MQILRYLTDRVDIQVRSEPTDDEGTINEEWTTIETQVRTRILDSNIRVQDNGERPTTYRKVAALFANPHELTTRHRLLFTDPRQGTTRTLNCQGTTGLQGRPASYWITRCEEPIP